MEVFKFILVLFTIKNNFIWIESCEITINEDLAGHNQPLLLHTNLKDGFLYPNSDDETIQINPGESIVLACPGGQFDEDSISTNDNVRAECTQENSFVVENKDFTGSLKDISCSRNPQTKVKTTLDKCSRDGVKGTIGFHVNAKSKHNYQSIIDFCHNAKIGHTVYAHTKIPAQIKNHQKGVARVEFKQDNFFKGISVRNVYRKTEQVKTIANIVGSMELAEDFIHDKGEYFFAKGHLVAKADFIFGSQQLATFSYVNAIPMWQNVNGKNWARLEESVRNYASDRNRDLEVWTGSLGILQIKDANRKSHDLYLHRSVVYDSISKAGVAFITINNPYLKSLDDEYVVCKDVCDDLPWFNYKSTWRRDKYDSGYTYCCKVDDFRNITINKDLAGHNQPLLLHTDLEHGFLYPNSDDETIQINPGESIVLACPGGQFDEDGISTDDNVRAECTQENSFVVEDSDFTTSLKDISCSRNPQTEVKTTLDKCSRDGVKGTIGFHVNTKKHNYQSVIDFCHNAKIGHTVYAHTKIPAQIKNHQKGVARVEFKQDNFFKGISLRNVYKKTEQIKTIANIVGSMELAKDFIHEKGEYYFARGHLVAKADFIFASQQLATFSYVNVIPMWQSINAGNWFSIEESVRNYAIDKNRDLDVWTGSLGIMQIEDVHGELQDIYLHRNAEGKQSIPVPKLLFKVVYDSIGKAGVAFITINNPYLKSLDDEYVVCQDVCDDMPWLNEKSTWKRDKYDKGYTYCCKVDDFRNVFPDLPEFQARKLLK
ncbi:hypothetical protein HCN44_011369 [Aphidius gifuensis]|uniref:DNA/RNA non-specific endonuclease/pyrophosphatase/phosphodiesterase domain-containing protein n=1 Tax=Aphidius gifuensis TaxID=684658 RepID=A0A835CV81_APHGI|nr:hypothetical protein HCN44_011369 [Aphidius gifuensis]